MTAPTSSSATPQEINAQARDYVLATAERMNQDLGTQNAQLPVANPVSLANVPTLRQKLFNVGIITSIDIIVTMVVNITAAAKLSTRAPWNVFSAIRTKDYSGDARVNAGGFQVWTNKTVRTRFPHNLTFGLNAPYPDGGQVYPLIAAPTGVGNNQVFSYRQRIPVAYDPESDLTGAILAQNNTGELFLEADVNPTIFGTDEEGVYSSGAGTINSLSVRIVQNYLAPAGTGNAMVLPLIDLNTVYELNGTLQTNSDLATGQKKLINIPNYRTVLSMTLEYVNGGAMNPGTDVTQFDWFVGGKIPLRTYTPNDLAAIVREHLGFDLPPAVYYLSTRFKPIDTSLYGNVQIGMTPSNVSAAQPTYVRPLIESFYPKGAVLTGLMA